MENAKDNSGLSDLVLETFSLPPRHEAHLRPLGFFAAVLGFLGCLLADIARQVGRSERCASIQGRPW